MTDPIFICGHRKSGTTVFKSLLDGHKDLLVYPTDLNLLYLYFPNFIKNNLDKKSRKERLETILFDDLKNELEILNINTSFSISDFKKLFFRSLNENFENIKYIIECLIESYASILKIKKFIPVIKETSIEIYYHEIKSWFPNSKFIQLVRDPRDNYASLKSGVKPYYSSLGEDEFHTLSSLIYRVRVGLEFSGILNKSQDFKVVKFEDLGKDLEQEMIRVCHFLNIIFSEILLKPTILKQSYTGNNFNKLKFKKFSNKNINNWDKRITKDEVKIIEFFLKNQFRIFGYNRKFNDKECIKIVSEFYKYENYQYYFHDRFKAAND